MTLPPCVLCARIDGLPIWSDADWQVVRVPHDDFPAFYRVVSRHHVREFSELNLGARTRCMALVCAVEASLIERLAPTKVNLAALGNVVPHLHWHVIARFDWDSHFPEPIWGQRQRAVDPPAVQRLACDLATLDDAVQHALANA